MDNTKVLLRSKLNLSFNLNYFGLLLQLSCIYNYSFLLRLFLIIIFLINNK